AAAQAEVGEGAPQVEKLRVFYNHPGYIEPVVEHVRTAFDQIPEDRRSSASLLFSAHSIPLGMADTCRYVEQLREACRLVADGCQHANWQLVYQSRSGPPSQPWLEPDILDVLRELAASGQRDVVVMPIGFISDHMEVLYDLDTEARQLAEELGINVVRA